MGASFARLLASAGINLVLIARKPGPLEEVAREARTHSSVQVRTLQLDITQPDLLDRICAVTDDLDVGLMICNAGAAGNPLPFLKQPLDTALGIVRLNVIAQTTLSHHFGNRMADRGRGGIVLVGSMGGSAGCANLAAYSASKSYTQIFGEALWAEFKPLGIDVLVLLLGRTETPALARTEIADNPGMPAPADPEDMARQALDSVGNGPVCVPTHLAGVFQHLRALSRREATEVMSAGTRGRK